MNKPKSAAVLWCTANKIVVYSVLSDPKKRLYKVEVLKDGKKHRFDKEVPSDEIESAINKTYKFYYDKAKKN